MSDGTCANCGAPATRKYCSRPCADIGRRKSERIQVQCPCGASFEATGNLIAEGRGKYCSKACLYAYRTRPSGLTYNVVKDNPTKFKPGLVPWTAGTKGVVVAWNKGLKGIHLSPPSEFQRGDNAGEKNWRWTGGAGARHQDRADYSAIHYRVRRERGRAAGYPCALADETCKGVMQWACISQEYIDVDDFMPLCRSHHARWDGGERVGDSA
jgi:hypothetical protein